MVAAADEIGVFPADEGKFRERFWEWRERTRGERFWEGSERRAPMTGGSRAGDGTLSVDRTVDPTAPYLWTAPHSRCSPFFLRACLIHRKMYRNCVEFETYENFSYTIV